jgi:hypothetical protein
MLFLSKLNGGVFHSHVLDFISFLIFFSSVCFCVRFFSFPKCKLNTATIKHTHDVRCRIAIGNNMFVMQKKNLHKEKQQFHFLSFFLFLADLMTRQEFPQDSGRLQFEQ